MQWAPGPPGAHCVCVCVWVRALLRDRVVTRWSQAHGCRYYTQVNEMPPDRSRSVDPLGGGDKRGPEMRGTVGKDGPQPITSKGHATPSTVPVAYCFQFAEVQQAIATSGYVLSQQTLSNVMQKCDRQRRGVVWCPCPFMCMSACSFLRSCGDAIGGAPDAAQLLLGGEGYARISAIQIMYEIFVSNLFGVF